MYSSHLAQAAYAQPASPVQTERGAEHAAFQRITARLQKANSADAPFRLRVEALHDNRRLWTLLAKDVLDNDNALPEDLRASIVYLFEFTQTHSRIALRDTAVALTPLIEINTAIMRGLRGEKGTP